MIVFIINNFITLRTIQMHIRLFFKIVTYFILIFISSLFSSNIDY